MELIYLALVVLPVWYWYGAAQAREQVVVAARLACERHGLLLLDETVLLERQRLCRDRNGRTRLRREYSFEFSAEGELRRRGTVVLFGGRILDLRLELDDGVLFDTH